MTAQGNTLKIHSQNYGLLHATEHQAKIYYCLRVYKYHNT